MSKLSTIAKEQMEAWSVLHREADKVEKEDGDLTKCNMAAIQLCFSTMIEVKDLVGIGTTRTALLEGGLQQPLVKGLLRVTR